MNETLKGLINAMESSGADSLRTMMDIEIDGEKYWLHLDIVKKDKDEDEI